MSKMNKKISVVIPIFNEADGLDGFYHTLKKALTKADITNHEVIFCDDGSIDDTPKIASKLATKDKDLTYIRLSRNFGKEAALAAGISHATGDAIMTVDGDGQHPVELISKFVDKWRAGAQVVIGIRNKSASDTPLKRLFSRLFYFLFNRMSTQQLIPGSTDFRLIDKSVQRAFLELHETERTTRGLIDWLGFRREFINFDAKQRGSGTATYSVRKLFALASNSIVSLSPKPLYLSGGIGAVITPLALLLGVVVVIEQLLLGDPLNWDFTGTAMLGILLVFLVGIMLVSLGILSLYISHIHSQSKQRPLYVIDQGSSVNVKSS